MKLGGPVRVLLADPSALFCRLLGKELDRHAGLRVVAKAYDRELLRRRILEFRPDAIVLSLEWQREDALGLLRMLRTNYPVPVIVYASAGRGAARAIRAVGMGALELLTRPDAGKPEDLGPWVAELAWKIRIAADMARPPAGTRQLTPPEPVSFRAAGLNPDRYLIVVGASTGGTDALDALLAAAPPDFPPVAIVQHIPAGFTKSLAQRLDAHSALHVTEALDGDRLASGRAVIARGDTHLVVRRVGETWRVMYTDQRPVGRHCPSVDVLFDSAALAAGSFGVGALLTGMGADGARGLLEMRKRGAVTIAQDASSCVVYGMPKAAVERGAVEYRARPEEVPEVVRQALMGRADRVGGVAASR